VKTPQRPISPNAPGSTGATAASPDARLLARINSLEASIKHVQRSVELVQRRLDHDAPRLHGATYQALESLLSLHRRLDPDALIPPLAGPFGGWAITSNMALLVSDIFHQTRPELVVELGSGTSTILMGHLLRQVNTGGRLISLEHDAVWYAETLEQVHRAQLDDVVDVRFAPLEQAEIGQATYMWYSLAALEDLDAIDVVFVDGPPAHVGPLARYPAGPLLAPRCRRGGAFIIDDIVREDERQMVNRWSDETNLLVERDYIWGNKGAAVLALKDNEDSNGA
jgi:predicted O-methyltransferase YrrM